MDTTTTVRSDFATRLYDKLAGTPAGKNLFFSPFSIRVALAMCAVGARGETRRVMAGLIGAPERVEEQNRQYARLLKSVHGDGERPFQLFTSNALCGQQGYHFNPDYTKGRGRVLRGGFRGGQLPCPAGRGGENDQRLGKRQYKSQDQGLHQSELYHRRHPPDPHQRHLLQGPVGRDIRGGPAPGTKTGMGPTAPPRCR
jgi:hypothetical protein